MNEQTVSGAPTDEQVDELFQPEPGDDFGEGEGQQQQQRLAKGQTPETPKGGQAPVKSGPTPGALTREEFLEGIARLAPQQQQRQLTPQEVDQMLQVWSPDDKFVAAFFDPEATPQARMAAFVAMRDGLMRQAMTAARYMIDMESEKLGPKLSAVETFIQEQSHAKMRGDFLQAYPGLQRYQKLMKFVSQQVEDSGYKAPSLEEGYKHLADEATKFIRENIDPEFDPSADASEPGAQQIQQNQQTNGGMPRMAQSGGRGTQGMVKSTKSGQQVGPDGGIWDD